MGKGREKKADRPQRRSKLRVDLRRHAVIAGAFALLALLGRCGIAPVQAVADRLPHGLPFSLDTVLAAASIAIRSPPSNVSVTLVDIDETLYREWGRPCSTPRGKLAGLVAAVAARRPAAIVLDVSLTCNATTCCPGEEPRALEQYLRAYSGAPLILVREMHVEQSAEPGVRSVVLDESPLDHIVAANPRISWAHTFYVTDEDGTVRNWREHWEGCVHSSGAASTSTIMSVPTHVLSLLQDSTSEGRDLELPTRVGHCLLEDQSGYEHMLLLGSPVIGSRFSRTDLSAPRRLAAGLLLDPVMRVDEEGYYRLTDRVAVIGASHSGSQDQWRTAIGFVSGMELIAHTIRFAAEQIDTERNAHYRSVFLAIVAFFILITIYFFLRPFIATLVAAVTIVGLATVCASYLRWLDIFESLETAIWLFIGYELILAITLFAGEAWIYPRWRILRSVLAERVRKEDPECRP